MQSFKNTPAWEVGDQYPGHFTYSIEYDLSRTCLKQGAMPRNRNMSDHLQQ
jgi:hypothetical protein